jgi:hypothetical protein
VHWFIFFSLFSWLGFAEVAAEAGIQRAAYSSLRGALERRSRAAKRVCAR